MLDSTISIGMDTRIPRITPIVMFVTCLIFSPKIHLRLQADIHDIGPGRERTLVVQP